MTYIRSKHPFATVGVRLFRWEGSVFFAADDPNTGAELWTSDGSAEGTRRIMALTDGPDPNFAAQIKSLPGGVCFNAAVDPNQTGLWQTDGTAQGTRSLAAFSSATDEPVRLGQFRRFMSRDLYFLVDGELFRYRSATGEVSKPVGYDGSEALRLYGSGDSNVVVVEVVVVDYFSRLLTYMAEEFLGTSDTQPGGSARDGYLRW